MKITILTLFPKIFADVFSSSIIGRAQKKGFIEINYINIRDFAFDKHKSVDDKPYGGGVGMLMRVDVVEQAIKSAKCKTYNTKCKEKIVLLDCAGKLYTQENARRYAKVDHLILICGHYEGIDARINHFVDEIISIGKYVLTGGEIPTMVITDSVVRLIPGVLCKKNATIEESYTKKNLLEHYQYTRPKVYKGYKVPELLFSGNHEKIKKWQSEQSIKRSEKLF